MNCVLQLWIIFFPTKKYAISYAVTATTWRVLFLNIYFLIWKRTTKSYWPSSTQFHVVLAVSWSIFQYTDFPVNYSAIHCKMMLLKRKVEELHFRKMEGRVVCSQTSQHCLKQKDNRQSISPMQKNGLWLFFFFSLTQTYNAEALTVWCT